MIPCFFLFLNLLWADESRIVSLNPALTEILFELDLGSKLVGTTTFSSHPEAAKKITTVGSYLKPQIEKIIELKPTHVLAFIEGNPDIVPSLKKAQINLISFNARTLEDFPNNILRLGKIFDKQSKAELINKKWTNDWSKVSKIKINKRAIIQIDQNPIFVTGPDTFISKSLERCGIINGFQNISGYKSVSVESLATIQPDLIVYIGQVNLEQDRNQVLKYWKSIPFTKNVYVAMGDADTLSRLGPRLPEAVLSFCQKVQKAL